MQLVLVSGLSGSGKSVALDVLEDNGFYCVDNLPAKLLPELVAFLDKAGYRQVAISIDVRSGSTLTELPQHIAALESDGVDLKVLFLESKVETLLKRFSETRRRHPLGDGQLTLPECIAQERELLSDIADFGHHVDTSDLNPNALHRWIRDFVGSPRSELTVLFQSFGFKHGVPLDADMVFDVRCLPNPHYDPKLRPLTGKDRAVIDFLEADSDVRKMGDDIRNYVETWLPCFKRDSRSFLTVAIGCTGGRHRSVYFAELLAEYFGPHNRVLVRHRELP